MTYRFALLAALAASILPLTAAEAAPAGERHCVVEVTGVQPSGELVTTQPHCYDSFGRAMGSVSLASFTLGVHYDGAGYTGSSFSVVGDNCLGGFLNMDATWNNRISSTVAGCPRIRHYDGYNLTGTFQTVFAPGSNLTTLNNKTSSIQYLS